jgi:hypothetical protein
LTDDSPEIELYALNDDGEEIKVPGVGGVNPIAEYVDGKTWRYRFSGNFEPVKYMFALSLIHGKTNSGNFGG